MYIVVNDDTQKAIDDTTRNTPRSLTEALQGALQARDRETHEEKEIKPMAQKYKNIPVKPEVYAKVAMAAEANGLGERGLGAQVENWATRELPVCDHEKQAVSIEIYPVQNMLGGTYDRKGWYCPTCKRVYQYSAVEMPVAKTKKQVKAEAVQS